MAEFCRQCVAEEFGEEYLEGYNDLDGLTTEADTAAGRYAVGLCEGCSPLDGLPNLVDHTGTCVSADCLKRHGHINTQEFYDSSSL